MSASSALPPAAPPPPSPSSSSPASASASGPPPPLPQHNNATTTSTIASCELVFDAAGATNGGQAVVWIPTYDDEEEDAQVLPVSDTTTREEVQESNPGEAGSNAKRSDSGTSSPPPTLIYSSHSVLHLATREAFTIGGERGTKKDDENANEGSLDEQEKDLHHLWRRQTSLRSSQTNRLGAASNSNNNTKDEVITCLAHVASPHATTSTGTIAAARTSIVVGYSSGRILLWVRKSTRAKSDDEDGLDGTSSSRVVNVPPWEELSVVEDHGDPVTVLDGMWLDATTLVVLAGSCSGAVVYACRLSRGTSQDNCHVESSSSSFVLRVFHRVKLTEAPLASVRIVLHQGDFLFLLGSAAPRHNKIHVHQCRQHDLVIASASVVDNGSEEEVTRAPPIPIIRAVGALHGHQDWVTCFDWRRGMLASGSKDCRIRLWNFRVVKGSATASTPGVDDVARNDMHEEDDDNLFGDNNSSGSGDDEDDDERGESRLDLLHVHDDDNGAVASQTSVMLDALLIGHEGAVTSVQWHPNPSSLFGGRDHILLSASMDRTILIWALQDDGGGSGGGAWTPLPRLGVAGGILGGPLGSSLLGFCRAVWEPRDGRSVVGHAYGGALHVWSMDNHPTKNELAHRDTVSTPQIETLVHALTAATMPVPLIRWKAMPGLTGHFDAVTDLCWERFRGSYFLTVSKDQTCRLWAPINAFQKGVPAPIWAEISRPQVHGYDLMSVSSLSTSATPHRIVTAADEKELRVYDAPLLTTLALKDLCGAEEALDSHDTVSRALRAYIPSLGLTNKSNVTDKAEEEEVEEDESDGLSRKNLETMTRIPLERDLGVTSVWPEHAKYFGHISELYRVTSTVDGGALPSSQDDPVLVASSTKARDTEAASIRLWDARTGKCLQVLSSHKSTVVSMSFSTNGQYLASSGKDRRICLWEKQNDGFSIAWLKDSAHKRIIWSIHFHPTDPTVFASGSRDGCVKVWKITPQPVCSVELLHSFTPTSPLAAKSIAVTSVSFAPVLLGTTGLLAVGTEPGLIQVWGVPMNDVVDPAVVLSIPVALSHGSAVTKLDWHRNHRGCSSLFLASSSSDRSCKVFDIDMDLK